MYIAYLSHVSIEHPCILQYWILCFKLVCAVCALVYQALAASTFIVCSRGRIIILRICWLHIILLQGCTQRGGGALDFLLPA